MIRGRTPRVLVRVLTVLAGIQAVSAQPQTDLVLVTARPSLEPYRLIGGRTAIVPLIVHAPEPEGLTVRAELVQLSSTLAMPLAGGIVVPLGVSAQPAGFVSRIELSVSLPAVSRETDFELRFRSFRHPDGAMRTAGRVALRVYPANLLEPVRVWAESHAIRLEDDRGSLAEFFRERGRNDVTELDWWQSAKRGRWTISSACCPSTRPMLATHVSGAFPSLTQGIVRTESSRFPRAPEPREILHVPKLLPA
jgi:hypothetical protein